VSLGSGTKTWCGLGAGIVSVHLAISCLAQNSYGLHVFGDVLQTILLLCCYLFTLPNQVGRNRASTFWVLISVGFALWLLNQTLWMFFEIVLEKSPTPGFWGDVVLLLHPVPMMMALAAGPRFTRAASITAAAVFIFWMYLYTAFVASWQYVMFDDALYARNFNVVYGAANICLIVLAAARSWNTTARWRTLHLHLLGAASVYALASYLASSAIDRGTYYTGSLYDLPLVCSELWFAGAVLAGASAGEVTMERHPATGWEEAWPILGALAAVIGTGMLSRLVSGVPSFITELRFMLTLITSVVLTLLVGLLLGFGREQLGHSRRPRLSPS